MNIFKSFRGAIIYLALAISGLTVLISANNQVFAAGGATAGGIVLGKPGEGGDRFTSKNGAVWSYHQLNDKELEMIERGEPIPIYGMEDASALGQHSGWTASSMTHSTYIRDCQVGTKGYYRYAWLAAKAGGSYSVVDGKLLPPPNPNNFMVDWQVGSASMGSNSTWHRSSNIASGSSTYREDLAGQKINHESLHPNGEAIALGWDEIVGVWDKLWDNPRAGEMLSSKGFE